MSMPGPINTGLHQANRMRGTFHVEVPIEPAFILTFQVIAQLRKHGVVKSKGRSRIPDREVDMMKYTPHMGPPCWCFWRFRPWLAMSAPPVSQGPFGYPSFPESNGRNTCAFPASASCF